jgi:tRNA (guanine37-N1)-methyltransferase
MLGKRDQEMKIGLITLLPEMFAAISDYGICGRAIREGLVELKLVNPRDFTADKHRTVDDKPFGGGPGMLMKTEPLVAAIRATKEALMRSTESVPKVVYLSPQGEKVNQEKVVSESQAASLILICGRYQGIDQRVLESEIDEEWSLGDFVISGGELAAMAVVDAMIRRQVGALGDSDSALQDSFEEGLLHCPEYTRPQSFEGRDVPSVLLSGDHAAIKRWRHKQAIGPTWRKRPDLLEARELTPEQRLLLDEYQKEHGDQ